MASAQSRLPGLYVRTYVAGTRLLSEPVNGDTSVCRIFDGDRLLGTLEYVGIQRNDGTHYGWRPKGSHWGASRLLPKSDAAMGLLR